MILLGEPLELMYLANNLPPLGIMLGIQIISLSEPVVGGR